ncbi:MAG: ATPase [Clostridiales bacterium]|jgi:vacuolar-type H+-ATPase subunit H|nr:ATPase [Clostridiales bacterium]
MEVLELLDSLEDIIERGVGLPLGGKCMLDRDELLDVLQEVRLRLPEDLKQAKWVKSERQRILAEAQKEANHILKGAEDKIISMINEHEITKRSYEQAKQIEAASRKKTREIRNNTTQYVENMLADAETVFEKALATLRENRSIMRTKRDNSAAPQSAKKKQQVETDEDDE